MGGSISLVKLMSLNIIKLDHTYGQYTKTV